MLLHFNENTLKTEPLADDPATTVQPDAQKNSAPGTHRSKWLHGHYFLTKVFKIDCKGNVYKALNLKKWSDIHWCIVKEGKRHQVADEHGRDMRDRLRWQYQVHKELENLELLPKATEYFEENGNAFLTIEFIEGLTFFEKINLLQKGMIWRRLDPSTKTQLIDYLLQLVAIVALFHQNGILHRDLSPVNFMVTTAGKLMAIDIELSYDFNKGIPNPAFPLGTPGYASPAQCRMKLPAVQDDIYGLGGLLIKTLTGLSPTKFNPQSEDALFRTLIYFTGNSRISSLICSCLSPDAGCRPQLKSIRHNLELYRSTLTTYGDLDNDVEEFMADASELSLKIEKSIASLGRLPLIEKEKGQSWQRENGPSAPGDPSVFNDTLRGFCTGSCGALYTLLVADRQGYLHGNSFDNFLAAYERLKSWISANLGRLVPGLCQGAAGFALLMAEMMRAGYTEKSIQQFDLISRLLTLPNQELTLGDGLAGQGLAIIRCAEILDFPAFGEHLFPNVETIIREQKADGSWKIKREGIAESGVKQTGLIHGVAGIAFFLLEYSRMYESSKARESAIKSLKWLLRHSNQTNGHMTWPVNPQNPSVDPWLEYGLTGISLVFIKAFEILADQRYKEAGVSALSGHPKFVCSNYFSQANGLSGLGEVYLEAARIFKGTEWARRAGHIATLLLNSTTEESDGNSYWRDGSDCYGTAGFMAGNSGIIHFLLRFRHPDKIKFPLIGI